MWKLYLAIGAVWLALTPPLLTDGRCTQEFDAVAAALSAHAADLRGPTSAHAYFQHQSVPVSLVTPEQCRQVKPRFLAQCGAGALVYAQVPVSNPVCRLYRDDAVRVQLHYDDRGRLARIVTDMAPYKTLPLPFLGTGLHWGR